MFLKEKLWSSYLILGIVTGYVYVYIYTYIYIHMYVYICIYLAPSFRLIWSLR